MDKLSEQYGEVYGEIINQVSSELLKKNKKYQDNVQECIDITEQYPNVRLVCEDKQAVALNVEEVKALIRYLDCYENRDIIQGKKVLLVGGRFCYYLLKEADMIKEKDII